MNQISQNTPVNNTATSRFRLSQLNKYHFCSK